MAKVKKEVPATEKRGRKKIEDENEKSARLPLFAKKKNHAIILEKVKPIVKRLNKD